MEVFRLSRVEMLTFTFDPELFDDDPEKAFAYLRKNWPRTASRLRKRLSPYLRSFTTYKVIEFKHGWPHVHVLVDTKRHIPRSRLSHVWKQGRVHCGLWDVYDAADYVSKDLRRPKRLPDYILKLHRFKQWSLTGFPRAPKPAPRKRRSSPGKPRRTRSIEERLASCGVAGDVVEQNPETGYPLRKLGSISDFHKAVAELGFPEETHHLRLFPFEADQLLSGTPDLKAVSIEPLAASEIDSGGPEGMGLEDCRASARRAWGDLWGALDGL